MQKNKNTYILRTEEIDGITNYFVRFIDGQGVMRETQVSRPVYLEFQHFVKQERNQKRWHERHIEQVKLTDEELFERALHTPRSVEETVLNNIVGERLRQIINELPEVQRRRFKLHYDFGLTGAQIAKMEGCTGSAVRCSISIAKEKIKIKFLKNYEI